MLSDVSPSETFRASVHEGGGINVNSLALLFAGASDSLRNVYFSRHRKTPKSGETDFREKEGTGQATKDRIGRTRKVWCHQNTAPGLTNQTRKRTHASDY